MKKRVISSVMIIALLFTTLTGRLYRISTDVSFASAQSHIRVHLLGEKSGTIYDRNGVKLTNRTSKKVICAKPSAENAVIISKAKGEDFAAETVLKGYFTSFVTEETEEITESEDLKIFNITQRYSDNVALHILGYTDESGNGVTGVEKYYQEDIEKGKGSLSVAFSADALGRMLVGEKIEIRNNSYYSQQGIMLTLDREIQLITENALKNKRIKSGAAVVMDVQTSAVLACASTPVYDRNRIEDFLNSSDAPFLNRALEAFPVGSVFKPVTAAAGLENGIEIDGYNCIGYIEKSGNKFKCNKNNGHGDVDLNSALAFSCNPYFIELSTRVGAEKLLKTAKALGFGKSIDFGNGFSTAAGTLPTLKDLNSDAAVGNFGFGQGKLTASPLQIAACFAAIGNGGIYNEPYIFKGNVNENGGLTPAIQKQGKRVLSQKTCEILQEAMKRTTLHGTGKNAFSSLFDSCTKTATAESGVYDESGNEVKYCWFAGFFPADNPKYVICILKENGNSGGSDGAPVFKEISEKIYIKGETDY